MRVVIRRRLVGALGLVAASCGPASTNGDPGVPQADASVSVGSPDATPGSTPGPDAHPGTMPGCNDVSGCFTVYAHGDHVLYMLDLTLKKIITVGPFHAPMVTTTPGHMAEDSITDIAVSPGNVLYAISKTQLYTASTTDGHVTLVGSTASCGMETVALTFTSDGTLLAGDKLGAFCSIDLAQSPPKVTQIAAAMGGNLALSGDLVAVADGTLFGTAYLTTDPAGMGSQVDNVLVKIDPATGQVLSTVGMTGFPRLFGIAFDQGKVFGFTHDGTGHVVTIDPTTGAGTLYGTFTDPTTTKGISFAGAGVSPMVPIVPKPGP